MLDAKRLHHPRQIGALQLALLHALVKLGGPRPTASVVRQSGDNRRLFPLRAFDHLVQRLLIRAETRHDARLALRLNRQDASPPRRHTSPHGQPERPSIAPRQTAAPAQPLREAHRPSVSPPSSLQCPRPKIQREQFPLPSRKLRAAPPLSQRATLQSRPSVGGGRTPTHVPVFLHPHPGATDAAPKPRYQSSIQTVIK